MQALGLGALAAPIVASVLARRHLVRSSGRAVITDPAAVQAEVGVVLGAGLRADGSPTNLLARRVDAGVDLYERGAVSLLVMSGADDRNGDQPGAMGRRAIELGVPADRVVLDRAGVDTAATCRRVAADHPDRPAVLVTQAFHADRTAYLAAKAGLDAVVLAVPDADVRPAARHKARIREVPASIKALFIDRF